MIQQKEAGEEDTGGGGGGDDPFHHQLSWQVFHKHMRPQSPLVPPSVNDLDVLQPRYPLPSSLSLQQAWPHLHTPYPTLSSEDVQLFRTQRWIRLQRVFPPSLLLTARARIITLSTAATEGKNLSHPDPSIYTDGIYTEDPEDYWQLIAEPATQSWNIQMMWAVDPVVRALVCCPRSADSSRVE